MSGQVRDVKKVGSVALIKGGWKTGVRWALYMLLAFAVFSIVTAILFNRYFMPGLIIVGWAIYAKSTCAVNIALPREEVERILRGKKYNCYDDGRWGFGAVSSFLSDKFTMVSNVESIRLEGSREILKKVARILKKA